MVAAIRDISRSCLDPNDFNSLHTIDTVKGHASFLPLACGFVCVRFTQPSPHPIDSVKGHATLSHPACRFVSPYCYLDLF
ncbi:hypothetical protein TNCV_4367711 [Trichonephila clavipes]|nr:hypothetical protein TNCV_4367711 [Trichonephila clavipes]